MLHLILGILKVIGIIILLLLGLLLLGVLALLFVPLRYQASGRRQGEALEGHAGVSWLLHLIGLTADFEDRQLSIRLKLFGFTVKRFGADEAPVIAEEASQKESLAIPKELKEESVIIEDIPEERTEIAAKELGEKKETIRNQEKGESLIKRCTGKLGKALERVLDFVLSIPEKILDVIERVSDLIDSGEAGIEKIEKKKDELIKKARPFLRDGSKKLYCRLFHHLKMLWRHYKPRKAAGWIHYGTGAPDVTGELTGLAYLVLPASCSQLELQPDFAEAVIEGDVGLKGHVRAIWLVIVALSLLKDREFRNLIRIVRRGQGGK